MRTKKTVVALLGVALLCWSCASFWDKIQNVPEGYQKKIDYKSALEKKYGCDGQHAVEFFSETSEEERIKLYQVYYPAELTTAQKKWPVVIMANGTGIRASKYKAIFRHLASWGFIVAGNEDEWTWDGRSVSMTQDYIIRENANPRSVFYQKVDTARIGLTGHSQGGMAVFTASSLFPNSRRYKALCVQSSTALMLADSLGWDFLRDVKAPMLMMGGCGNLDANMLCPLEHMQLTYDSIGTHTCIMGRIKSTDHGEVLPRGDAYMTAWMRYWLCDDEEAGHCFFGSDAEMLTNTAWQDVKRRN